MAADDDDELATGHNAEQGTVWVCSSNLEYCNLKYVAKNAVDGDNSTCMRGERIYRSSDWWRVDLGDIHSVYSIRIIFRNYSELGDYELRQRGRFAGFYLFLTNTKNLVDGILCYKDGPELPPLDFSTTCIGYGRFFIFYNERFSGKIYPEGYTADIVNELCEVNVKGCFNSNVYGSECNISCPENCRESRCHIVNGTCFNCKAGWIEDTCNKPCSAGFYGDDCKYQCKGHCKDNLPCNHSTGECDDGCDNGWSGADCNEFCPLGTYGPYCLNNCSGNCWNGAFCNRVTGNCDRGCSPGYIGERCQEECSLGYYGKDCLTICTGHCENNGTCHHVDGICLNGCEDGYFGKHCNKTCPVGFFSRNCSNMCSKNCIDVCRYKDGVCSCAPGWKDTPNCSTECLPGKYGINCLYKCSGHCKHGDICSRFDGHCPMGCMDPFLGLICDTERKYEGTSSTCASGTGLAISIALNVTGIIAFATLFIFKTSCILRLQKLNNIREKKTVAANINFRNHSENSTYNDQDQYEEVHEQEDKSPYECLPPI
ncbi:multiple epidermal growth factor-like domains protein 10 [Saccostrea cucullata]|uniref:multiple epidermal growth factor-like domains protein 10 n=1 Tax=Saccostrea cuccullata TaxID=36930 RepID=UPI002ED5D694